MTLLQLFYYAIFAVGAYYLTVLIFDFLMRGFSPFLSSRPWLVDQVNKHLDKLDINNYPKFKAVSLGSGRSGFFSALGKKYPQARLYGYEKNIIFFILSWLQALVKRSKIKVRRKRHFHRVKVDDADLIYCYAPSSETIRELGDKFKFECRPGTVILSNGFVVPFLDADDIIELSDTRGRYSFLSKNRFFSRKNRRANKENKIYVYVI